MRNSLLMGVTVSALAFAAVPASAQVAVNAPIAVERSQDDAGERDDYDDSYGDESSYGPYRPAGFGVQVYGGGSANEYGPYGYPDRGYGGYAEWGYRNGGSPLRAAFDYGRREGYDAGIDAATLRALRADAAPLLPVDPGLEPPLRRAGRLRRELPQRVPLRLRGRLSGGAPLAPLVSAGIEAGE